MRGAGVRPTVVGEGLLRLGLRGRAVAAGAYAETVPTPGPRGLDPLEE